MFSTIRGRWGFNDRPTSRQAGAAIRAVSGNAFLKRSMARNRSVEDETDFQIEPSTSIQANVSILEDCQEESHPDLVEEIVDDEEDTAASDIQVDDVCDDVTLRYVLGSLIHRHNCNECNIGTYEVIPEDASHLNFTQG